MNSSSLTTCLYFQAHVPRAKMCFFVATLRSYDHMVFDRTLDKAQELVEFFVPQGFVVEFVQIMNAYVARGTVIWFKQVESTGQVSDEL